MTTYIPVSEIENKLRNEGYQYAPQGDFYKSVRDMRGKVVSTAWNPDKKVFEIQMQSGREVELPGCVVAFKYLRVRGDIRKVKLR